MSKFVHVDGKEYDARRVNFSGNDESFAEPLVENTEVTLLIHGKVKYDKSTHDQFGVHRLIQGVTVAHIQSVDEQTAAAVAAEIKRRADEQAGQESLDSEFDTEPENG